MNSYQSNLKTLDSSIDDLVSDGLLTASDGEASKREYRRMNASQIAQEAKAVRDDRAFWGRNERK